MPLLGINISTDTIIANITMLQQAFNQEIILGLYWTLEVELYFYFIGWLMFMFGKLHNPINLFITSLLLLAIFALLKVFHFSNEQHIGFDFMPLFLSIMFWGGLFRNYYDNPQLKSKFLAKEVSVKFLFIALTVAILTIPFFAFVLGLINNSFKYIQTGLAYTLGITLFLLLANIIKIQNAFIVWLGTISYSMYLFHPIVFFTLFWWLKTYAPDNYTELHLGFYLLVNLVLTIIISALVDYLIEQPAMKYSHYLTSYNK